MLHVVRDGRDMAFSKNTSPLKKYGLALKPSLDTALLQSSEDLKDNKEAGSLQVSEAEKQIAVWAHENKAVAEWGAINLSRYRWVRIEDFNRLISEDSSQDAATYFPSFYHALQELVQVRSSSQHLPSFQAFNQVIEELKAKPMGSHDHSPESESLLRKAQGSHPDKGGRLKGEEGLKRKYGKWHSLATPTEIKRLESIGGEVLRSYGYMGGGRLVEGQARL